MNASYDVNKQQSETWAEVACMMLVPGCQGIGKLTGGVQRIGTMQCGEPALLIQDMRWPEFVRANFMWTFLMVRPRQNAEVGSAKHMASLRITRQHR